MLMMNRDFDGDDYEMLQMLDDAPDTSTPRRARALSESTLVMMPCHTVEESEMEQLTSSDQSSCIICLGRYEVGDELRTIPCLHKLADGSARAEHGTHTHTCTRTYGYATHRHRHTVTQRESESQVHKTRGSTERGTFDSSREGCVIPRSFTPSTPVTPVDSS